MKTIPEKFIENIDTFLPKEEQKQLLNAIQEDSPTSVRLHPVKKNTEIEKLPQVAWCTQGRYLPERPSFTLDPLFWAGTYYVQEASSMFLSKVLEQILPSQPIKALDLCAAPGGKSTLISSLIGEQSLLVSNEVIKARASILVENVVRWGATNTLVTNNDPSQLGTLESFFDVVVVDAPCSGEGMFRKEENALQEWSEDNVKLCAARQKRILEDVIPCIDLGGYLIYSTCTYNQLENEENLLWLMQQGGFTSVQIPLEANWGIEEVKEDWEGREVFGYRFYPHRIKGEGFFIACFQKEGFSTPQKHKFKTKQKYYQKVSKKQIELVQKWVKDIEKYEIYVNQHQQFYAVHQHFADAFLYLIDHLYIRNLGTYLGDLKGKDFVPAHDLAMSLLLPADIPQIELDKETALGYLRKNDITLDTKNKGWAVVTYQSQALGWVKLLPNRVNNYYPSHLRVKM